MASRLHAGFYLLQLAKLTAAGYPMGTLANPEAPVNGTVYSPFICKSPVQYAPASANTVIANSYAGQRVRGSRPLGKTSLGVGTLTVSEFDPDLDALLLSYTVDVTIATAQQRSQSNVNRAAPQKFLAAFTTGATPSDSTSLFDTIMKNNVFFDRQELGVNQTGGENPNNVTYQMYINTNNRKSSGILFSIPDAEEVISDTAPIMFSSYVDDASGTSIVMPYALDYTEHAGAHNVFTKAGADNKANVSSITSATLTITPGAAAAIWVVQAPSTAILSYTG